MKRLPIIVTVAAVAALSASLAYWGLQLFKPAQRALAAAPIAAPAEPNLDAAKGLFGGETAVVVASNYQLKGVVSAADGRGSAAILAVDGKPAMAVGVGREVLPGVLVKEIHPKHVLLSEGGVVKRIDLAADPGAKGDVNLAPPTPMPAVMPPPPPPATPPKLSVLPVQVVPGPERQ